MNWPAMVVVDETPIVAKKSCRGIASKYANPSLIEKESKVASLAFSALHKYHIIRKSTCSQHKRKHQ